MSDVVTAPPYGMTEWHYDSTAGTGAPAVGFFRANSVSVPTVLSVHETDRDGVAFDFTLVQPGDRLVLQQLRNATHYWAFDLASATDMTGWWELAIDTIVGSDNGVFATAQDYVFLFRHVYTSTEPVAAPARLVSADELPTLVADVVEALTAEVKADPVRDADKLDRAARTAIRDVEIHLDYSALGGPVYATAADVDTQVFDALVTLGATYLKRVGFAYGVAGYDGPDQNSVLARGATLTALTTGHKSRFGVG